MRNRLLPLLAVLSLLATGGCASTGDAREPAAPSTPGLTLTVVAPADGETVHLPFVVQVTSNVPLGRIADGVHHIHIWFDNNPGDYNMIQSDVGEIIDVAPGPHTLHISLRNPDHSPTGVETSIEINVVGGPGPTTSASPSGGYGGYQRY